jgi:microcystin-dependent protein
MAQGFTVAIPLRLFTAAGVPAVAWKIHTYATNSTTPQNTWSDGQLLSLNTNPVTTDGNGYFRLFLAQGSTIKLQINDDNDVPQMTFDYLEPMIPDPGASSVTAVPTGGLLLWGTSAAPTGFLLCDGSAVSRATYAALNTLWAAASYPFGNGDGVTTFNVPDLRGRFPIGKSTSGTGSTLGGSGGAIDHTHTGPSHTHTMTVTRDGCGSTTTNPNIAGRVLTGLGAGGSNDQAANDLALTTAAGGTGNTGTANPPFLSVNYIVKT